MQPCHIGAQLPKLFQFYLAGSFGGRIWIVSFFFHDLVQHVDALVTDKNSWPRNQLFNLMLGFTAEGTVERHRITRTVSSSLIGSGVEQPETANGNADTQQGCSRDNGLQNKLAVLHLDLLP